MAIPQFTMRELLEAGIHFGHRTHRWNPKMSTYIYGSRNGIHIMDLQQTVPLMYQALAAIRHTAASGGRVLFVGSKRQAQDIVRETAERCGQYFVNHRWLGGTLTNWKTINASIKRLKELEEMFSNPEKMEHLTKKEQLMLEREKGKLDRSLGGIKDMGGLPEIIFVIDTNKENISIQEAGRLGIPVVGILDSNCDPEGITYPIPGNDDSTRALKMYCRLASDAVLDGIASHAEKVTKREIEVPMARQADRNQGNVKLSPAATAAAEAAEQDAEKETAAKPGSPTEETEEETKKTNGSAKSDSKATADDAVDSKVAAQATKAPEIKAAPTTVS